MPQTNPLKLLVERRGYDVHLSTQQNGLPYPVALGSVPDGLFLQPGEPQVIIPTKRVKTEGMTRRVAFSRYWAPEYKREWWSVVERLRDRFTFDSQGSAVPRLAALHHSRERQIDTVIQQLEIGPFRIGSGVVRVWLEEVLRCIPDPRAYDFADDGSRSAYREMSSEEEGEEASQYRLLARLAVDKLEGGVDGTSIAERLTVPSCGLPSWLLDSLAVGIVTVAELRDTILRSAYVHEWERAAAEWLLGYAMAGQDPPRSLRGVTDDQGETWIRLQELLNQKDGKFRVFRILQQAVGSDLSRRTLRTPVRQRRRLLAGVAGIRVSDRTLKNYEGHEDEVHSPRGLSTEAVRRWLVVSLLNLATPDAIGLAQAIQGLPVQKRKDGD